MSCERRGGGRPQVGVVRVRANRRAAGEQDLRSGEGLVHVHVFRCRRALLDSL